MTFNLHIFLSCIKKFIQSVDLLTSPSTMRNFLLESKNFLFKDSYLRPLLVHLGIAKFMFYSSYGKEKNIYICMPHTYNRENRNRLIFYQSIFIAFLLMAWLTELNSNTSSVLSKLSKYFIILSDCILMQKPVVNLWP